MNVIAKLFVILLKLSKDSMMYVEWCANYCWEAKSQSKLNSHTNLWHIHNLRVPQLVFKLGMNNEHWKHELN
jgi:hypothetical protein